MPTDQHDRQRIVLDRDRGDTLAAIADRYGISHQRVTAIVREATEQINQIELELLRARKQGEVIGFPIPYERPEVQEAARAYFNLVVRRLRDRGLLVQVSCKQTTEGPVYFIEDLTNYEEASK